MSRAIHAWCSQVLWENLQWVSIMQLFFLSKNFILLFSLFLSGHSGFNKSPSRTGTQHESPGHFGTYWNAPGHSEETGRPFWCSNEPTGLRNYHKVFTKFVEISGNFHNWSLYVRSAMRGPRHVKVIEVLQNLFSQSALTIINTFKHIINKIN